MKTVTVEVHDPADSAQMVTFQAQLRESQDASGLKTWELCTTDIKGWEWATAVFPGGVPHPCRLQVPDLPYLLTGEFLVKDVSLLGPGPVVLLGSGPLEPQI